MTQSLDLGSARILVTGGSGFLGKHLVQRLRNHGSTKVFVPRSADYDLSTEDGVKRALKTYQPEVVIHLAALVGGIGANRSNPGTFLYKNLTMGALLIEQSRLANVSKFVMVGSICSYPKFTPVPFKESDLWNGYPEETNAPYGVAKKVLIVQLQAYREQFGFNGVNILPVNLYGPGDNFDLETSHVIPALIRKCIEARDRGDRILHVWGTGVPTREFLYVEDAARAIHIAAATLNSSEPMNIGSGREIRIKDLVSLISERCGFKGEIRYQTDMPDGQPRRCLDVTRAEQILGFKANVSLEDGLTRTVAWYEAERRESVRQAA
jgi:GDP-L-fucose synthase